MLSRTFLLLTLFCLAFLGCRKPVEPINIGAIADQVESITVYDISTNYSQKNEEQLQGVNREPVDLQVFRELAPHARYTQKDIIFKGGYLAFVKLQNGTQAKVGISVYGEFFKIIGQPGYYVFDREEDRQKFRKEYYDRIIHAVLHQERQKAREIERAQELRSRIYPPQKDEEIQVRMGPAEAPLSESTEPE